MRDGECVVLFFQLLRSFKSSVLFSSSLRSGPSCKVSRVSPFFEYNLQTPLNARSRFKPPATRRALLYQGVKISRPAGAASVPPSRNSVHPCYTYLSLCKILTAGCLRARARRRAGRLALSTQRVLQQFVLRLFRNLRRNQTT